MKYYSTIRPSTHTLGRSFADDEIILVSDHMPPPLSELMHDNDKECFIKNTILELFNKSSIDIESKLLVFDHYMCLDDIPNAVFNNGQLRNAASEFLRTMPDWKITATNNVPTKNLSAMMNKQRPNRLILSMMLSNLFDVNDISYSSNNYDNSDEILTELLLLTSYKYNKTQLPEKWIEEGTGVNLNSADRFIKFLYSDIFKSAAVSLITEPTFYELGCIATEKTIMSIYSGHMMIWVGGWKSAEMAAKLGLDVFDDVIDHSYQYIEHPTKRSIEAVLRNMDLLTNLEYQIELKHRFAYRLADNLKLIRDINKLEQMTRDHLNDPAKYDYVKSIL
jgi:hypothetical protein